MTKRFVALSLFATLGMHAQAPAPQLSLPDAEAMALKNHPQVLAAQANYLRANQITVETRSANYPSLNGDITSSQARLNTRIGAGFLTDSRLFNRAGTGITLSQLISDFGRTHNLVANSEFEAKASEADYRAARDDVVLGVDQAYYDVLLAQQLVTVAQQTIATRQTVVDQVSELAKNKLKSQVDLSFAQVNLSEARLMLLRAQAGLENAYANLSQALGTQQLTEYKLADQPMPPAPPDNADSLITEAFRNRPELASVRFQRAAAEKFVYAERDLKRPTVSLSGVAGLLPWIEPGNANPGIPLEYEGFAVNLQVPIFNGHLFTARRRAAEYQLQAADQRVRDLGDRVARDVRTAWERARTAFESIGATAELLQQATQALDLAQGRYNLGLSSIVELSQAQLAATQAQVENLNAKYEYQSAYSALEYTLGSLHP